MSGARPKRGRTRDSKAAAPTAAQREAADLEQELGEPAGKANLAEQRAWQRWKHKNRRTRYPKALPKPPKRGHIEVLYAKLRDELKDISDGEKVLLLIETDAWQSTVGDFCRELDALADKRRAYTHEDCEKALLYQRLTGERTYRAARNQMVSGDANEVLTRQKLGFDRSREHIHNRFIVHELNRTLAGVPSEATLSRHRVHRLPEPVRDGLYTECFIRLVIEHAHRFPELAEELRRLGFDGSTHKSMLTPGFVRNRDRTFKLDENGRRIPRLKVWEGGSLTDPDAPESKRGHGFMTTTGHTAEGLPVCVRTGRIHDSEGKMVLDMLATDLPRIRREAMRPEAIGVMTMDGAFAWPRIRAAARANGFIENTHTVSSGSSERTADNLERHRGAVFHIEGHPKWRANGLRELYCMCGNGTVSSRQWVNQDGSVSVASEGHCDACGDIHVTSGEWRRVRNTNRFVKVNPNDNVDVRNTEWMFGNYMTHGSDRAVAFGRNRYAIGEGLHGNATTAYKLFKDRGYWRRMSQVHLDVLMTYCLMHGLAMETRRRRAEEAPPPAVPLPVGGAPPPAALAA